MRCFEWNGSQYQVSVLRSDEEFSAVEEELNVFEAENQRNENKVWMAAHPSIVHRTELLSFTARLKLFCNRALIVGRELPSRRVVYTQGAQFSKCFLRNKEHVQSFGVLERVAVDKRRDGLSKQFFVESAELLQRSSPLWGYIERLNQASLGRTVQLEQLHQRPDASIVVYGGHTMLLRHLNQIISCNKSVIRNAGRDFLHRYFTEENNFAPSPDIWNEWEQTGKLLGAFEMIGKNHRLCMVAFLSDWTSLMTNSDEVLAKKVLLLNNVSFFDLHNDEPVYDELPVALAIELMDAIQRHLKYEYAIIDLDDRCCGPIVEGLLCTPEVISLAREYYDCVVWDAHLIDPKWKTRFLDPRHLSSLLYFERKHEKSKM